MPSALASRGLAIETGWPSIRISPESAGWAPDSDAHQRRLAGAVAPDQADDLAGVEVDGDAVDGMDAAERHADVAHLDERDRGPPPAALTGVARRWLAPVGGVELPASSSRGPPPHVGVEADGGDQDDADDDVLGRRIDVAAGPCPSAATA